MSKFKIGQRVRLLTNRSASFGYPRGSIVTINEDAGWPWIWERARDGGRLCIDERDAEAIEPAPAVFADADHMDHHAPDDEDEMAAVEGILRETTATPARDIGMEFLKAVCSEALGPGQGKKSGYWDAMRDLADAYGKKLEHVNRMEIVDA